MEYFPQLKKFKAVYPESKRWKTPGLPKDKKIAIYCEQGIGDFIQFIRFIPLLEKNGNEIYVYAPESIIDLFKEIGIKNVSSEHVEEYDLHCSIISLPFLLKMDSFSDGPYVNIKKTLNLSSYSGFKVGITWAGNPQHPNDINRSFLSSYFRSISNLKGIQLFSLQKDLRKRAYTNHPEPIDLTENSQDIGLIDMASEMDSFLKTASIIKELDLIITADTAVLHLAGAMGKPTWALIPWNPDWRWKIKGNKTVWYDSVKLFRQPEFQNWESVFSEIETNLLPLIDCN